jgi:CRP-like cAMP-binding protein
MAGSASTLKQADIFSQFSAEELDQVTQLCEERIYDRGEIIFQEGSASDELYIIAEGEVLIQVDPNLVSDDPRQQAAPMTIATLRRGQSFGEIALVDRGIRSATARSSGTHTRLLIIPAAALLLLCAANAGFGYRLMYNLAVDLALKIRNADLLLRADSYSVRQKLAD